MAQVPIREGTLTFKPKSLDKDCQTWYKIYGDPTASSQVPLIVLHGGPAASHTYLLPLADLASRFSIPVIFYDQIGIGRSTHLPEKAGDEAFWTEDLFCAELDNLIDGLGLKTYDILGHSWGGMFGSVYAGLKPRPGLRKLVLSSAPASMETFKEALTTLRGRLPDEVQAVLNRCEREGRTDSEEYGEAMNVFYKRHLCRSEPWPAKELQEAFDSFAADAGESQVYGTMYGPSELCITGSLGEWSAVPYLKDIKVPTFLINGSFDEVQDVSMAPFFEHIPKVKWLTLDGTSHFAHVEARDRWMAAVGDFLKS